jgi:hypothetical protein
MSWIVNETIEIQVQIRGRCSRKRQMRAALAMTPRTSEMASPMSRIAGLGWVSTTTWFSVRTYQRVTIPGTYKRAW